jgi:phage terminase small subunit
MPAPRKPTALLRASGAIAHDPQRYRDRAAEPKPTGQLGNAPKHFGAIAKKIWRELAQIAPPDILTNADRWTVELLVTLMAKLRTGTISTGETSQLTILLGKLGMNPADRSKVQIATKPDPDDEWSAFE